MKTDDTMNATRAGCLNKGGNMAKQLTKEERLRIYRGIGNKESLSAIAKALGKDRSTIAREIKRNRVLRQGSLPADRKCRKDRAGCGIAHLCDEICIRTSCWHCAKGCGDRCPGYEENICPGIVNPPYVCNACSRRSRCHLDRYFYDPAEADAAYRDRLSGSRSGFSMDEDEVMRLNGILSEGTAKGHSIRSIIAENGGEEAFGYSARTIYRYIDGCVFPDVRNIDLVRKVRYKPRKRNPSSAIKVDRSCRIGRKYSDYLSYIEDNPETATVQIDTVEGKKGGCCLLTIHFTATHLMLAIVRERNDSASVIRAFNDIQDSIGLDAFCRLFPAILTDNGTEFSNPSLIESSHTDSNLIRTRLFYCDPGASFQKGSCEVNHEMIRRIIPKGSEIPSSQDKINLMMSHINSYSRHALNGKSPYEAFSFFYGEKMLMKLGLRKIPARDVVLKPELLK